MLKLSWEIEFISLIEDVLDWSKTAASLGKFVCKHVIEDGEMKDKSSKLVLENKKQL